LTVSLGSVKPSATVTASWQVVTVDDNAVPGPASSITVNARGLVSASVPDYAGFFPAYAYSDWIGGSASLPY
jgi:hypothetical protein